MYNTQVLKWNNKNHTVKNIISCYLYLVYDNYLLEALIVEKYSYF